MLNAWARCWLASCYRWGPCLWHDGARSDASRSDTSRGNTSRGNASRGRTSNTRRSGKSFSRANTRWSKNRWWLHGTSRAVFTQITWRSLGRVGRENSNSRWRKRLSHRARSCLDGGWDARSYAGGSVFVVNGCRNWGLSLRVLRWRKLTRRGKLTRTWERGSRRMLTWWGELSWWRKGW